MNKNQVIQKLKNKLTEADLDERIIDFEAEYDDEITAEENESHLLKKIEILILDLIKEGKELNFKKEKIENESKKFYNNWSEGNKVKDLTNLFNEPKIIGLIADSNSGKSNLIYYLIKTLQKKAKFSLFTYGLKKEIGDFKIYSIEELEKISNSIIFLDEFYNIFDLTDRKKVKMIEKTIRLIFHNNNILVLCGVPENFRKFISNKIRNIFFGKCTLGDFVNGSRVKEICLSYGGVELGSSVLNLPKDKFIVFDGHYRKIDVPYLSEFDTKKNNSSILKMWEDLSSKNNSKKNVPKIVEKKSLGNENNNLNSNEFKLKEVKNENN